MRIFTICAICIRKLFGIRSRRLAQAAADLFDHYKYRRQFSIKICFTTSVFIDIIPWHLSLDRSPEAGLKCKLKAMKPGGVEALSFAT